MTEEVFKKEKEEGEKKRSQHIKEKESYKKIKKPIKINMIKFLIYAIVLGFILKILWWIFGNEILSVINYLLT